MPTVAVSLFLLPLAMLHFGCAGLAKDANHERSGAFFRFKDSHKHTFVFKLTDQAKIIEARQILAENQAKGVMGKIVQEKRDYNKPWSFHLEPGTVAFFEFAIEVCDASINFVEQRLNEVGGSFLPNNLWCPWSSKLIEEVRYEELLQ